MDERKKDEYRKRFFAALSSTDVNTISSTVEYINNIIVVEKDSYILSIFYDKARLLYKLKRYDEALDSLNQSKNTLYNDFIRASFLVRIERDGEALIALNKIYTNYKKEIFRNYKNTKKKRTYSNPCVHSFIIRL